MQLKQTSLSLALASAVTAQSLTDALNSQNSSLSVLNGLSGHDAHPRLPLGLLQANPGILTALNNAQNVTLLAPNNDALTGVINGSVNTYGGKVTDSRGVPVLRLHGKAHVPHTLLNNQTYANVTGGQVVQVQKQDNKVVAYSGLKYYSTVKTADVNYTGGVIHIIDRVLTLPQNNTMTLTNANLTALSGAVKAANMGPALDTMKDVTIFAPDNAAFASISNLLANMSSQDVGKILGYHVVPGKVAYSSDLSNTTIKAQDGTDLKITVENNGAVFVNAARVTVPNVLVANGVVHVINQVLNPDNTSQAPDPAQTNAPPPAYNGGSSASGGSVPFTSDVPSPTGTSPAATSAGGSGAQNAAAPLKTGAVGAAALFGGAALIMNW
ncbi:Fasciclin-like arabinogalactan protein [Apiospora kogelbergensis]|uniref:Fasciclin-like arabinogalactan protein n=1 Tax=Apiospora kogelbergensis TaxID=1337665 RepID=UPI00312E6C63